MLCPQAQHSPCHSVGTQGMSVAAGGKGVGETQQILGNTSHRASPASLCRAMSGTKKTEY